MDELEGGATTGRLRFEVATDDNGSALVRLSGELDMATAQELENAVAPIIDGGPDRLIVDARDLGFADSSAIALWVRWANAVPHLEIREPSKLLRAVIHRMGLAERLHLAP